MSWIRNRIRIRMSLFEHFSMDLSLYLEARIWIRIRVKSRIQIKIRIGIRITVMQIHNDVSKIPKKPTQNFFIHPLNAAHHFPYKIKFHIFLSDSVVSPQIS